MTANRETIWNLIMRFSPAAIALSLGLAMVSSAGLTKPELPPISAQAMRMELQKVINVIEEVG